MRWRDDGKELFYIALDDRLMSVPMQESSDGRSIQAAAPVPLFATRVGGAASGNVRQTYMVSPDGQRFLMNTVLDQIEPPITILMNWRPAPGK